MSTIELNNAIAYINTYIKANNNNEITGVVMNNVLKDIVNKALNGLHFIGIVDSNSTLPINTPFAALAVGADTIEGVTIPSGCIAIVYNNGETGDTTQVKLLVNVSALILAHNTSNTAHNDIRTTLQNLCESLQAQIDALSSSSDVVDVVADYTELQNYDTSGLSDKDIVKVLEDSTHDDATTYYRWVVVGGVGQWVYVGEQGAYYTKAEADARFAVAASLSALRTIVVGTTTCVTTTSGAVGLANGDSSKCVIVTDNELYIAHSGNKYEAINGDSEEYGNGELFKENDATKFKVSKGTTSVELEKDGDVNVDTSGDVNITADNVYLNGNRLITENEVLTNIVDGPATGSARSTAADSTIGQNSFAFGGGSKASGDNSQAFGGGTIASGAYSHAEGGGTTASGACSHSEGNGTQASGDFSHSEGGGNTASGYNAHAEGGGNTASGWNAHAEGGGTQASGMQSHAEGLYTIANHKSQHVFGEYNVADTNVAAANQRGDFVEIVGNGTANNARSNARTLDWSGNEVLAGGLKINGTQDVAVINPATSSVTTLVAGKLNTLGSVDYATIALPATPGTAEYNGTFTSTTSGDISVSLPLTYWSGDTTIVIGKTYSFSIQNGVGFIIQLD